MSEQKMCFVPTEDGDVEVPVGTAILVDGDLVALADDGGFQVRRSDVGTGIVIPYYGRTAVIVAFPDGEGGWITPDATKSEWVPLTEEQVAALPDRTPVRVEGCGVVVEGGGAPPGAPGGGVAPPLYNSGSHWWIGSLPHAVVHVHSEDVPADPNTDLVERMAKAAYEDRYYGDRYYGWDQLAESSKDIYRQQARSAPAAVREEK